MYNNYEETIDDSVFTEAVFIEGKETVQPLLEDLKDIKEELMVAIQKQDDDEEIFNPTKYWRSQNFKKFEDDVAKIFGFRNVQVQPYIEKYSSKDKIFESQEINCVVYKADRYPIEGLVTEKGFYDKSRSISMDVYPTLGLIKLLSPEELLAVFLHEFGHCIDPALVTIKYTEVNILSKYLTNRRNKLSRAEKKYLKKKRFGFTEILFTLFDILILSALLSKIIYAIVELFGGSKRKIQKRINKIRQHIKHERSFDRTTNIEAYADNFARMYGYGAYLASSFKKMEKSFQKELRSRLSREKDRQDVMLYVVEQSLKDVHKTDIHRIHSLMKEYKKDLDDPMIPDIVKEQIKDDMNELKIILDYYLNNFDDFQNNLNKAVHEELSKKDGYDDNDDDDSITESTDDFMESYKPKNIKLSEDDLNLINEIIPIIKEEMSTDCAKMEFIPMTQQEDLNNITKSKIGGVPYWPEDMKWPTEKGRPLILAIQINFAELPPEIKFNYPTSGIIQVFIDPNTYVSKFNSIPSISIFHQSTDKPQSSDIPASSFTITPKINMFATCKLINALPAKDIMNFNKESRIDYHNAMKNAAKKLNIDFKSTFIGNDNTGTPIYHALEDYFGSASDDDFNDFVNYVSDNVIAGYDVEYHMSPNLFTLSDFKSRTLIGAYYYPDDNHEVDLYQYDISGFSQNYSKESADSAESSILDEVIDDNLDEFTEKSHGKLKYDFRSVIDIKTAHILKIVYSLDNIKIDNDENVKYHPVQTKAREKYGSDSNETLEKNIIKDGNLDHRSNGQKVLAIEDTVTGKKLKEADYIGIYGFELRIFSNEVEKCINNPKLLRKIIKDKNAENKIKHIKVGDIDTESNYKSTFWPKDKSKIDKDGVNEREKIGISRGAKLNDLSYSHVYPEPFKHPKLPNSIKQCKYLIKYYNNEIDDLRKKLKYHADNYKYTSDDHEMKYYSDKIRYYNQYVAKLLDRLEYLSSKKENDINESSVDEFTESKSNNAARNKTKQGLTSSEYSEVHERFGDVGCSFAKDKDGYYCYTHRARSKSYPTIAEIPQDKVDFIVSTG